MGIVSEAEVNITEEMKDMVTLYKSMTDAMRANKKLMDLGQGSKIDKTRYNKLIMKVDALWLKLKHSEQLIICEQLVKDGYMDQRAMDMLTIFGGTIDQSNPPVPCIRLDHTDKPTQTRS